MAHSLSPSACSGTGRLSRRIFSGGQMYKTLDHGWGHSLLRFIALGSTPIPFLFIRHGERLRAGLKSRRIKLPAVIHWLREVQKMSEVFPAGCDILQRKCHSQMRNSTTKPMGLFPTYYCVECNGILSQCQVRRQNPVRGSHTIGHTG